MNGLYRKKFTLTQRLKNPQIDVLVNKKCWNLLGLNLTEEDQGKLVTVEEDPVKLDLYIRVE